MQEGSNTLAVEVHQEGDSSSDLVIDVELLGVNSNGSTPAITENTQIRSRVLMGGEWSALNEATFYVTQPASASNLAITEIFYNPPGPSEDTEYLELQNVSTTEAIHLDGLGFLAGITFVFPAGTTLAPGERLLLVKNIIAFEAAFGVGLPIAGEYEGSLSNGGETIALEGFLVVSFEDDQPWPELADGDGRSLVLAGEDPSVGGNWRPSAIDGGSPGGSDAVTFPGGDFDDYAFGGFSARMDSAGRFSASRHLGADDLVYALESSSDLRIWQPAFGWSVVSESVLEGRYTVIQWARNGGEVREFLRVKAERIVPGG